MPVHLVGDAFSHDFAAPAIHIGLINNMPDGALKATERQFRTLLDAAANGTTVQVSLFALPEVPRSESARAHIDRFYTGIDELWDRHLDGLIVTGTEPRAQNLQDEPYWGSLSRVIEWAGQNTHSTVFSCLAAHAAVLHLDGIGRRRLAEKRFGVFECAGELDHPLTNGLCETLRMPHSRWNDLAESELVECGYQVLTRSTDGGVDSFARQGKSLFVFFQGHPEYEASTLLLEYRRDIGRYLRGERETYPAMPEGYFDLETADLFAALRARAIAGGGPESLTDFACALVGDRISNGWKAASAVAYGNWVSYLQASRLKAGCGLDSPPYYGVYGVAGGVDKAVDLFGRDYQGRGEV
jgi:homoserine O-succinyltransferase